MSLSSLIETKLRTPLKSIQITMALFLIGLFLIACRIWFEVSGSFAYQAVSGAVLLGLLIYQMSLLYRRVLRRATSIKSVSYHHWVGVLTVVIFAIHVETLGYLWTRLLVLSFFIVVLSSFVGIKTIKYKTRTLSYIPYTIHIVAGSLCVALGIWHGVIALLFE